jgi:uncharacterized protein YcbX
MTETLLTVAGLAHDRSFMVVGDNGVFRSQRRDPWLAAIHPEINADGDRLTLRLPGFDVLTVDVDLLSTRRDVELFGYAKLAIRCAVTMVDQDSGTRAGPEPLRTLATYRRAPEGGVAFGVKLSVVRPGKLALGDEVNVQSWGEPELR